jgi:MFS family permease
MIEYGASSPTNPPSSVRGFDAQVNGAVLAIPAFRRQFGYLYDGSPTIPAPWLSAFNMSSSTGQFFGGFLCSYVADRLGRKGGLALGVFLSCGGIIGEIFSFHCVPLLISKLILGVGLGFYLTIGPLYCSEVSSLPICTLFHIKNYVYISLQRGIYVA